MFDQTSHKESLRFRENAVGLPVLDEPGFVPAPGLFDWLGMTTLIEHGQVVGIYLGLNYSTLALILVGKR